MYTGTLINDLIDKVDRHLPRTGDEFLDLCAVKQRLADRTPMTAMDEAQWWKADRLQSEVVRITHCGIVWPIGDGHDFYRCNKPAVAVCYSCAGPVCESCKETCCAEVLCEPCLGIHQANNHQAMAAAR